MSGPAAGWLYFTVLQWLLAMGRAALPARSVAAAAPHVASLAMSRRHQLLL